MDAAIQWAATQGWAWLAENWRAAAIAMVIGGGLATLTWRK